VLPHIVAEDHRRRLTARGRSLAGRVGSATAPDPRRHDDGIAMSYVEECQRRGHPRRKAWVGAVPPQPTGHEGLRHRTASWLLPDVTTSHSSPFLVRYPQDLARDPPDFCHGLLVSRVRN